MDVQIRGHIPCPAPVESAFQVKPCCKNITSTKKNTLNNNKNNNNNYNKKNNKNILVTICIHLRKFLLIFFWGGEG